MPQERQRIRREDTRVTALEEGHFIGRQHLQDRLFPCTATSGQIPFKPQWFKVA